MDKKYKKILIIITILIVILFGFLINNKYSDLQSSNSEIIEEPKEEIVYSDDFEELISQLNTSARLIDFLNDNFTYSPRVGSNALNPEEFFEEKKGGPQDFASFASYVLHKNGFISFSFVYESKDNTYYAVSLRDTDLPKYIYFDNEGAHIVSHGWSFRDLCQKEEERLGIKIERYGTVSPTSTNLEPQEWVNY